MEHSEDRRINVRFQLPEGVHASVRIGAALKGQPMHKFLEEVVAEACPAREDWQQLPLFQPRVRTALQKDRG